MLNLFSQLEAVVPFLKPASNILLFIIICLIIALVSLRRRKRYICPHCHKKVTSTANGCSHCGMTADSNEALLIEAIPGKKSVTFLSIAIGVLAFIFVVSAGLRTALSMSYGYATGFYSNYAYDFNADTSEWTLYSPNALTKGSIKTAIPAATAEYTQAIILSATPESVTVTLHQKNWERLVTLNNEPQLLDLEGCDSNEKIQIIVEHPKTPDLSVSIQFIE